MKIYEIMKMMHAYVTSHAMLGNFKKVTAGVVVTGENNRSLTKNKNQVYILRISILTVDNFY